MRNDFAIFIMSYNRASHINTLHTLKNANYTGKYYIIVSDDDPQLDQYKNLYCNCLYIFNKDQIEKYIDTYDNSGNKQCILYARNYCFILAKQLNLKYFLQFDDDYVELAYRYPQDGKLKIYNIKEFDRIVDIFIEFLENTGALSVAFAQHGDFIGGAKNKFVQEDRIKRKAMNSFFCKTSNPFQFYGRMNDDVNTYLGLGKVGGMFFTVCDVSLKQKPTQQNKGGMSDLYNESGTYVKSFYTVMSNPSCVYISTIKDKYVRIHHRIFWNKAIPKIISSKYKIIGEDHE